MFALPSASVFAFDAELRHPAAVGGRTVDTYHRWMEPVVPARLAGLPALSVPCGFGGEREGPPPLPMGVQLVGPANADAAVLALGRAYCAATRHHEVCPPHSTT